MKTNRRDKQRSLSDRKQLERKLKFISPVDYFQAEPKSLKNAFGTNLCESLILSFCAM